jgi:hypothetical protein
MPIPTPGVGQGPTQAWSVRPPGNLWHVQDARMWLNATLAGIPGDVSSGFFVSPGRCFRLVYSRQLQSDHCYEPTSWQGRWIDAKGRVHRVWSGERHVDALVGARRIANQTAQ